jgi:methane monooxygenase PmoA-like
MLQVHWSAVLITIVVFRLGFAADSPTITIMDSAAAIEARLGDQPLLRYNKAHVEPPAGVNPKFGRSAHLHPVWTPGGATVTDELPPDHLHQSGIFLAFTKTEFEGRDVDFWNLGGGKGRVRFKELQHVQSGPVGHFRTVQEHVDLTAGDDKSEIGKTTGGKVALLETWDVRVSAPNWKSGYWLLDIASSIRCATDSPLKLPEYHYGGMAIRAAREWTPKQVNFLTSEGDDRLKGNHTRPRWCNITGSVEGKAAGIALLTHPTNFRFPEPLRIHPTMPYMVYTPSFLGDWEITPAAPHNSRYRFVVHDGNLSGETLNQIWQDYAKGN